MGQNLIFYLTLIGCGFLFCLPFGAASLEMMRLAMNHQAGRAYRMALGTMVIDGSWALLAWTGVRLLPSEAMGPMVQAGFFIFSGLLIGLVGVFALRDARAEKALDVYAPQRKQLLNHYDFFKGVALSISNPLTVGSWLVAFSVFKRFGIEPASHALLPLLFIAVISGYGSYFVVIISLAGKLRPLLTPALNMHIGIGLGYVMLLIGGYFEFAGIKNLISQMHFAF